MSRNSCYADNIVKWKLCEGSTELKKKMYYSTCSFIYLYFLSFILSFSSIPIVLPALSKLIAFIIDILNDIPTQTALITNKIMLQDNLNYEFVSLMFTLF